MSNAKEILDERFAKGEISEEEYDRFMAKLNDETPVVPKETMASAPVTAQQSDAGSSGWWKWGIGAAILAFVVFQGAVGSSKKGLTTGNIVANGSQVSMKVSNSSKRSDDVVIRLKQNKIEKCVYITRMKAGRTHNLRFRCPNLRAGKFTYMVVWADSVAAQSLAKIAKRIK